MTTNNSSVSDRGSSFGGFRKFKQSNFLINNILLATLLALIVYFSLRSNAFLTLSNFTVLLTNYAAIGVVVSAMAILVIAGHVDLSVGSNIGLSAMVTAVSVTQFGVSAPLAIVLGVLAGAAIGAINGVLCGVLRFNPVIVTLGMLSLLRGITLLINPTEVYGLGDTFFYIGNGRFLDVPVLLWIVTAAFVASAIFIVTSVWGRYVYAIGINVHAAFLAAVPVKRILVALYVATGAAAGLAGVLLASRLDGVSPGSLGLQMELQALTIILLGGVAFAGGRGRIFGVVTAWFFLGVLDNGLTLLNVPPFIQLVASGLALILAASLDALGAYMAPRIVQRQRITEQLERAKTTRTTSSATH